MRIKANLAVSAMCRHVTCVSPGPYRRKLHTGLPHLSYSEFVQRGSDSLASVFRVNGIQTNLTDLLFGIERKSHEANDVAIDSSSYVHVILGFRHA